MLPLDVRELRGPEVGVALKCQRAAMSPRLPRCCASQSQMFERAIHGNGSLGEALGQPRRARFEQTMVAGCAKERFLMKAVP